MDLMDKDPISDNEAVSSLVNLKADIRRNAATSIGVKIEEMLDGAERKVAELGGAKKAMQAHAKNLLGIVGTVDAEVEKSIPDLETAALIKTWLGRTVAATENLIGHLSNIEQQALGEAVGYKAMHDYIQKVVKEIDEGKANFAKAVAEGRIQLEADGSATTVGGPRVPGTRPGLSIAQQRREEATPAPEPQTETELKRGRRKRG
jgi:hypothetical protein